MIPDWIPASCTGRLTVFTARRRSRGRHVLSRSDTREDTGERSPPKRRSSSLRPRRSRSLYLLRRNPAVPSGPRGCRMTLLFTWRGSDAGLRREKHKTGISILKAGPRNFCPAQIARGGGTDVSWRESDWM